MINKIARHVQTGLAFLVLVLMAGIVVQVVASAIDLNPLVEFSAPLPLLGNAITLNSVLDFQWHLLVIIGLVPSGIVWMNGKHVRVDFLYQLCSVPRQNRIDFAGNLVFALPFFALVLPASIDFLERAWRSDEGSRNGGLNDLWLIKAGLPLGLGLLALAVLLETIRLTRRLK